MPRTTVRVRPSRAMSLMVAVVGLGMLLFGAGNGAPGFWIVGVLAIVGISLANVFSTRGIASGYLEVDSDDELPFAPRATGRHCTSCGLPLDAGDRFCRECGAAVTPARR